MIRETGDFPLMVQKFLPNFLFSLSWEVCPASHTWEVPSSSVVLRFPVREMLPFTSYWGMGIPIEKTWRPTLKPGNRHKANPDFPAP